MDDKHRYSPQPQIFSTLDHQISLGMNRCLLTDTSSTLLSQGTNYLRPLGQQSADESASQRNDLSRLPPPGVLLSPCGPSPDDGPHPASLFEQIHCAHTAPLENTPPPPDLFVPGLVRARQLAFESEQAGGPIAELLQGHQVQAATSPTAAGTAGPARLVKRTSSGGQPSLVEERQALFSFGRGTESEETAAPVEGRFCAGANSCTNIGAEGAGPGRWEDEVIMRSEQPKIISHAWLARL